MQLFSADATIFFLSTKSWKNHPQKLLRKTQIHFFSLTAWAAQTAQTEEFMFQIVAYRPTVYRTGEIPVFSSCKVGNVCISSTINNTICQDGATPRFAFSNDSLFKEKIYILYQIGLIHSLKVTKSQNVISFFS